MVTSFARFRERSLRNLWEWMRERKSKHLNLMLGIGNEDAKVDPSSYFMYHNICFGDTCKAPEHFV